MRAPAEHFPSSPHPALLSKGRRNAAVRGSLAAPGESPPAGPRIIPAPFGSALAAPEEEEARQKRVIRFKSHDRNKHQDQHRRNQNGVGQSQALPGHVHENSDDQARLQDHEEQDERPPQISLEMKVVDKIGARTENEEPRPNDEIEL